MIEWNEIIAEATTNNGNVRVTKIRDDLYNVIVDGIVRHPNCTSEAVIRALCTYLHAPRVNWCEWCNGPRTECDHL